MGQQGVGKYAPSEFATRTTLPFPSSSGVETSVSVVPDKVLESFPMCKLEFGNLDATIREAGLYNGVVLEQPERMMRD